MGRIDNPAYKGVWKAKQVPNEKFVENVYAYDDIGAVGFELWTVNKGSIFDNILLTDSFEHAKKVGEAILARTEKEKDAKKAWKKANGEDMDAELPSGGAGVDDDAD